MIPPELVADGLQLKPLDPAALGPDYTAWLNDPAVNRFLEIRFAAQTEASVAAFVRDMNASPVNYLFGIFADGRHIGNIKLGPIDTHHRRGEVGLMIGARKQWGKGHARRAIAAVTDFAFDTLGLHKVTAGCYGANEASRRAFIGAGWREAGRYAEHVLYDGRWSELVRLERINPRD